MPLRSRSRADAPIEHSEPRSPAPAARPPVGPPPGPAPVEAKVHILADARILIDLTDGDPRPTTDMVCPNCSGPIRVEHVDPDLRRAELECLDCHFHFAQRLQPEAHEHGVAAAGKRGRFTRRR